MLKFYSSHAVIGEDELINVLKYYILFLEFHTFLKLDLEFHTLSIEGVMEFQTKIRSNHLSSIGILQPWQPKVKLHYHPTNGPDANKLVNSVHLSKIYLNRQF